MPSGLILAIDQGTTNTKALLVDASGRAVFRASTPVSLVALPNGMVEQDANVLFNSVLAVMARAVGFAQTTGTDIKAIAISNQRETAVAWDAETGMPLAPAVGWQCGRSAAICARNERKAGFFRQHTGLPLAPLVSAGKWAWLIENVPPVQRAMRDTGLRLGTVDSWLIYRLTGGAAHATDITNASRTGLLGLSDCSWDPELLAMFGIPLESLPSLKPSSGYFGACTKVPGLEQAPICAAIGDSHAALFGHGQFTPGTVKATYGTGSSLMAITSTLAGETSSLARTIAWSALGTIQYALEGNIAMTGSAVQWLGEFLGFDEPSKSIVELSSRVADAAGVYFVPAMAGLGAPYWDADARGAITGLDRSHTRAHLARAALDAIAYQVADVLFEVESVSGLKSKELLADGGATRNSNLMQFQAHIVNRPVLRSRTEELSAVGAAWLAGLELKWWKSLAEIEALREECDRFNPGMTEDTRKKLYTGWQSAVASARQAMKVGA
ncbi:MAG TPA: FGGY family carbohydrate kinase [Terracidiphilus sp.]|nr:FGGY family carbohydrate kinase [Terracidiphilus sp.]